MANRVDNLHAWRVFVTYAETGSLSACSEVMGIEPSSVSRTIESLEKGIGQELVLHNSRPMELTESDRKPKNTLNQFYEHIENFWIRYRLTLHRYKATLSFLLPLVLPADV